LTGNATASPVHAITRLREVVARLAELEDGGGEAGRWFVNVMIEYQSGAHLRLRLDEAAGLIPKPGHNWWWEAEKLQRRDEYLREIARRFCAPAGRRRLKDQIIEYLEKYEAGRWKRDKPFKLPPEAYRGTVQELLFYVLKCGPAPGPRAIERAVSGCPAVPKSSCFRGPRPSTTPEDTETAADDAGSEAQTPTRP